MANDFFTATGSPADGSPGLASVVRAEFANIALGFDKLPTLTGNDGKLVKVQGGRLIASESLPNLNITTQLVAEAIDIGDTTAGVAQQRFLNDQAVWTVGIDTAGDFAVGTAVDKRLNVTINNVITATFLKNGALQLREGDEGLCGLFGASHAGDTFLVDTDKTLHHYGIAWKEFSDAVGSAACAVSGFKGIRLYTDALERVRLDQSGRLMLGATTPFGRLTVDSDTLIYGRFNASLEAQAYMAFASGGTIYGYLGSGVGVTASNSGAFSLRAEQDLTLSAGGTTVIAKAKASGAWHFPPRSSAPGGAGEGDVYMDTGAKKLRVHNGTTWVDLH